MTTTTLTNNGTYNRTNIFKSAWVLVKTTAINISNALKKVWEMAKKELKTPVIETITLRLAVNRWNELLKTGEAGMKSFWVAEIKGKHPKWKLDRQFIQNVEHVSGAGGSAQYKITAELKEGGYYHVSNNTFGGINPKEYYCQVVDGSIVELPRSEVYKRFGV